MKKIVLGMLLASSSLTVIAAEGAPSGNWIGGIGYVNLSGEAESGIDISVGGIVGSLGYKIESGDNFHLVPEVRIGAGIRDDSVSYSGVDVTVELDRFLALSLRGQFEFDNGVYLFAAPTYANVELTASVSLDGQSASATEDSWEFGIGGGAGYSFSKTTSAEATYERFDGTDTFSVGLKLNF